MKLHRWLLAVCLLALSACSTKPLAVPAKIDPPPVVLTVECLTPDDLPDDATALDLSKWALAWVWSFGCERSKRQALIEAWPR